MEDMRLALAGGDAAAAGNYLHKVNAEWEKLQSAKQELQNQLLALQTQLEQLQEETFRLETAKDDYRIRCKELVQELVDARSQNEELTSLADEAQSLKDEMEVLRHSSDKVSQLEGTVEYYKKNDELLNDELLNDELLKKSAYIDDMEPKYNANTQRDMNRLLKQREELNSKSNEIQSLHGSLTEALVSKEWVEQRVLQVLDVTQHSIPDEMLQTNREEVPQMNREEEVQVSRDEMLQTNREEVPQMNREEEVQL
ncbi:LOW QUALITY PROTEIN: hypothetical protein CRUP_004818 [Coryphaenoides rupestris]|nr:LOW QUALITY PROTEIN: hypothetical protein CRUP_004818 [Coryphaenoides rupestris]